MATGSRTLTLKLLADIDNFQKNLKNADNNVSGFEAGIQKFSKVAGAAFLAAGVAAAAYASKLAIDGVKSAIEDEAAQAKLAKTLENVTGATDAQTKAVEDYILKTSLAYNVTDEDLRPSLDRLVRSTKDVEQAQKLQSIALDVAAGTGKSLAQVSEALARAHDGNFASLKKLGVTIDDSIIKQKDFDAATAALAKTFQGQASAQADTFEGKLGRLKIAFNEGKETIGAFILDAITPLVDAIVKYVVPAVTAFTDGIGGASGLKSVLGDLIEAAKKIFIPVFDGMKDAFNNIKDAVMANKDEFETLFNFLKNYLAPFIGGALKVAIEVIGGAIATLVDGVGTLIRAFETAYNAIKKLVDFAKNNPITKFFTGASYDNSSVDTANLVVDNVGVNTGGTNLRRQLFGMTPEQQAEYERTKAETAKIRERIAARARGEIFGTGGTVTNINVTGSIDPIGTARTINNILTNEGTINGSLVNLGLSTVLAL